MKSLMDVVVIPSVVVVDPIVVGGTTELAVDAVIAAVVVVVSELKSGVAFGEGIGRSPRKTSNIGCEAATLSSRTLAAPLNVPVAIGVKLTSESGSKERNCEPRSTRS